MAFGQEPPRSTNPFEDESDVSASASQSPVQLPSPFVPFVKIPIVIVCTILVVILLVAGTATTAISYPPRVTSVQSEDHALNGNYKVLGPVLLTAGIFLLVVNVILCASLSREAYHVSRSIGPLDANTMRPMPISLVSGPFFIATTDPMINQPSFMPFSYNMPRWIHPNAPTSDSPDEMKTPRLMRSTTATISRSMQPPFNPDTDVTTIGA